MTNLDEPWLSIDTAPSGRYVEVERKNPKGEMVKRKQFVPQPCHVLLDGKVYQTWKLETGRWNGFCEWQKGDAWCPYPLPPRNCKEIKP